MDEPHKANRLIPIAHRKEGGSTHGLTIHLRAASDLAFHFAAPWGGDEAAQLATIWHDLGKYAAEFQAMIRAAGEDGDLEGGAQPLERVSITPPLGRNGPLQGSEASTAACLPM